MTGFEGFDRIRTDIESIDRLLKHQNNVLDKLLWEAQTNRKSMDIIRTNALRPLFAEIDQFIQDKQLGFNETLEKIAEDRLSFSRFGDGELSMMLRPEYKLTFQQNSSAIRRALKEVITQTPDGLLIGFPFFYHDLHWSKVWADIWDETKELFKAHEVLGLSHVSRPIYFSTEGQKAVEQWRKVWDQRKAVIITGAGSRFDLPDELFSNLQNVEFLHSSPVNAFEHRSQILRELKAGKYDQTDLFLVALGPAGTVLTADISRMGLQAIDIGHLPNSFENVFKDGSWPEQIPVST